MYVSTGLVVFGLIVLVWQFFLLMMALFSYHCAMELTALKLQRWIQSAFCKPWRLLPMPRSTIAVL